MADEVFNGTDMVRQLLREGQSVTDEAGDALPHGVVEALNMIGFAGVLRNGVAPQLPVVPAPPCNQAFERMRGTPTLPGWCPTGWRDVIRQQFADTPAMIRDARRHRRCRPALGVGQTGMGCAEIIDRPDQIHTML